MSGLARATSPQFSHAPIGGALLPGLIAEANVPCRNSTPCRGKVTHGDSMAGYLTYTAERLFEVQRILKSAGSIYLDTGPQATHYLRAVMDALFGHENFKSEIIWQREAQHAGGHR